MKTRIGPAVEAFWADRMREPSGGGRMFYVEDLHGYVRRAVAPERVAPASADRILRELKKAGRINYRVVNRAESLYVALPVQPPTPTAHEPSVRAFKPGAQLELGDVVESGRLPAVNQDYFRREDGSNQNKERKR